MKNLMKPLLIASAAIIGMAAGVAQAQVANYDWLRTVQLNPNVMPSILSTQNRSFYVMNNVGVKQVFVVANPTVCVDSRITPSLQNCVVSLSDLSLHDNAPVYDNEHRYIGKAVMTPDVSLHYTQTLGNTAMNVTEVKTLSIQQGY